VFGPAGEVPDDGWQLPRNHRQAIAGSIPSGCGLAQPDVMYCSGLHNRAMDVAVDLIPGVMLVVGHGI
jgi:hypothetical protein